MSLIEVWNSAATKPFNTLVGKSIQFSVASHLLFIAIVLTGYFGLNRSLPNLTLLGLPAAAFFGFGSVVMICACGVYV